MAGLKFSMLKKSFCNSINHTSQRQSLRFYNVNGSSLRSASAIINRDYYKDQSKLAGNPSNIIVMRSDACVNNQCYNNKPMRGFLSTSSNLISLGPVKFQLLPVEVTWDVSNSGGIGNDWTDKVKEAWQSAVDAVTYSEQKAKEISAEMTPYAQQLLDSHPYLKNVVVPIGWTLTGTVVAWVVMPRLLRRFHKYSLQTPAALLSGGTSGEQISYEKSIWGALEDPIRYAITFMAFSQSYIAQTWSGAVILSFVWFLHRWKTNVFNHVIASATVDRERLLTLDKVSSVGLFVIGLMALAEACGVAVQSILTVGGIGGVATAFAAKDVLGNVLSGLSMQFSKPFSLGDTIKAGAVEGQVVEMGLTTTSLLNAEKFPILVPNSLFSSQAIVNKSRAQWRAMVSKIPVTVDDVEKIPQISNAIKSMLKSNPNIYLGKEAPYCYLSRIESSFAELTLGCNLKTNGKL
ncbi:hypothetical protein OIU76_005771 [Salix suchowensis]|nr:hypothetical protein OIU76_005771 [Salix suchowensis]